MKKLIFTIAQIKSLPGQIDYNTNKIIEVIENNKEKSDLIIFPELSIPGYCHQDLAFNSDYIEHNLKSLELIKEHTDNTTVIVGFIRVKP